MPKVTVYRFKVFDIISGESISPPEYATLEAIKEAKGVVIRENSIQVEASMLDGNGMYKLKEE